MTYCIDFFRKFKKDGNFCGLDKTQVSRLTAYLEIVELLMKQKIPEEQIYRDFTVNAATPLIAAKGDAHTEGLNFVTSELKEGKKVTNGSVQATLKSCSTTTLQTERKPQLPAEKGGVPVKFGVKVCRERKCPDLQRDPKYPDSPEHCAVTHGMPGSMTRCIKEMDAESFIRHISGQLNNSAFDAPNPGVKNCPKDCPYKIFVDGEKFVFEPGKPGSSKVPAKIGKCALTGKTLGEFGACPCNVLGNPKQEDQIRLLRGIVITRVDCGDDLNRGLCAHGVCPDGKDRGAPLTDDNLCPVLRVDLHSLHGSAACPLWKIPAKLLPVAEHEPKRQDPAKCFSPQPGTIQKTDAPPQPSLAEQMKEPEPGIIPAPRKAPCMSGAACEHLRVDRVKGKVCVLWNQSIRQLPKDECYLDARARKAAEREQSEPLFHRASGMLPKSTQALSTISKHPLLKTRQEQDAFTEQFVNNCLSDRYHRVIRDAMNDHKMDSVIEAICKGLDLLSEWEGE